MEGREWREGRREKTEGKEGWEKEKINCLFSAHIRFTFHSPSMRSSLGDTSGNWTTGADDQGDAYSPRRATLGECDLSSRGQAGHQGSGGQWSGRVAVAGTLPVAPGVSQLALGPLKFPQGCSSLFHLTLAPNPDPQAQPGGSSVSSTPVHVSRKVEPCQGLSR